MRHPTVSPFAPLPRGKLRSGATLVLLLVSCAFLFAAQPPRDAGAGPLRIVPSDPMPPDETPIRSGWTFMTTRGIASDDRLGPMWAASRTDMYLWAFQGRFFGYPGSLRAYVHDGDEDRPTGGRHSYGVSTLYHFDGSSWTAVLSLPRALGGSLYGTGGADVFAAAVDPRGAPFMFHFDGTSWQAQPLPGSLTGAPGAIAGTPNDMYFRLSQHLLHYDGVAWHVSHSDARLADGHELSYVAPGEIYAKGRTGDAVWDGAGWTWQPAPRTFETEAMWGARDALGRLQMFAAGCNRDLNEVRLWGFTEDSRGSLCGSWGNEQGMELCGLHDEGQVGPGVGIGLWGGVSDDVYLVANHGDCSCLFRFDGATWRHVGLNRALPHAVSITGTVEGDVWIAYVSGQILNFHTLPASANSAPDCSAATVSATELWPPDHGMVPVSILGITDPDGDAFEVRVTAVRQDEPLIDRGDGSTCPDASIGPDGRAALRAERAGGSNGRVYTLDYTATDLHGGECSGTLQVCVSPSGHPLCVDDGASYASTAKCESGVPRRPGAGLRVAGRSEGAQTLEYSVAVESDVLIRVHDVAGRVVATLDRAHRTPGTHQITWDTSALPTGVYFCRMRAGQETAAVTLIVSR